MKKLFIVLFLSFLIFFITNKAMAFEYRNGCVAEYFNVTDELREDLLSVTMCPVFKKESLPPHCQERTQLPSRNTLSYYCYKLKRIKNLIRFALQWFQCENHLLTLSVEDIRSLHPCFADGSCMATIEPPHALEKVRMYCSYFDRVKEASESMGSCGTEFEFSGCEMI